MKETYTDKKGKTKTREHWNAYGNRKKKDKSRYVDIPCITNKFKGHTHKIRKKEKNDKKRV